MLCHSLVKAGVFEQITGRSRTADKIAEAGRLHRDALYRALRRTTALESTGRAGDRYALAPLGRAVLKDTPGSLQMAGS